MTTFIDFTKESNDFRDRIVIMFKAMFERQFLDEFYTLINELYKGNFSVDKLKKILDKNKNRNVQIEVKEPLIKKEDKYTATFTNSVLKAMAVLYVLGEVYYEIQNLINNTDSAIEQSKLMEKLNIVSDSIVTIESQRNVYLGKLGTTKLQSKEYESLKYELNQIDNAFVDKCISIKKIIEDIILQRADYSGDILNIENDIINIINGILKERELEEKIFGKNRNIDGFLRGTKN